MELLGQPGKEWEHLMRETKKHEVALVKKAIIDKYGFEPSEVYCRDLIAFVDVMTGLPEEAIDEP
jgi:hypothetical protein